MFLDRAVWCCIICHFERYCKMLSPNVILKTLISRSEISKFQFQQNLISGDLTVNNDELILLYFRSVEMCCIRAHRGIFKNRPQLI